MSKLPPSRTLTNPAHGGSLATVLTLVREDGTLSKREHQDYASALRKVGEALGRPLDTLPAHPTLLRERLQGFVPAMAGIKPKRWMNAMSLVRKALKHTGFIDIPTRGRTPFAPKWAALFRLLTDDQAARFGLSRLARYCTTRGIDPDGVDDGVFAAFLDDLENASLCESPRKTQRKAIVIWTKLARTLSGWPQQRLTIPSYSRTYRLAWDRFPQTLKADLDAYLDHLAGRDILEEIAFKPLCRASITTVRNELSVYLSALVHRGHDPHGFRRLSDVVALPTVKDGLRFFLARAKDGGTDQPHRIARRVTTLAQHWVKVEARHLAALQQLCKQLDPGSEGMTENNRARLRQFDDPENVRKLLGLPTQLEREAARCKVPSRAEALLVQTALAVEILLMLPVRRANLVNLNLERHFTRSRGGVVHLVIPAHEVKNDTAIEAVLPREAVRLLDLYVDRYRPLLLGEPSPWLFPGIGARPKSGRGLGRQISDTIKRKCGLLVHPHLFRHIAAKLYLDAHPGAYGVIRLLHGHKSVNTTTKFYCGAENAAAIERYDTHVLTLRGGAPARLSKPAGARR
jgi:integrase